VISDSEWEMIKRRVGFRRNPQLQVLGDTRRNKGRPPSPSSRAIDKSIRSFHGSDPRWNEVFHHDTDIGDDRIDLVYLGHAPAVSWVSGKRGSARHRIKVEDEWISFKGFRPQCGGSRRPVLALRTDTNEAVLVGGFLATLRRHCDHNGVLGYAPAVEYVVDEDAIPDSSKETFHYVHEFKQEREPVLRWDDEIGGLVYDKDRTLMDPELSGPEAEAAYYVEDWFHEVEQRHGSR